MGTRLHEFASEAINLRIKLIEDGTTISLFVNDAIDYKMRSEQPVWYSDRFFGTADAISYRRGVLRIFDLKTGKNEAHMDQLKVYAAEFCLEYKIRPKDIKQIELRIYQFDQVKIEEASSEEIQKIMSNIVCKDRLAKQIDAEEYDL